MTQNDSNFPSNGLHSPPRDLSRLDLRTEYRTPSDDPVRDFYVPCLANSSFYRRAVGYFRSSVYLVVGHPMVDFARSGGTISLICSPELMQDDIDAIAGGYISRDKVVADRLAEEIDRLLADGRTAYPVQVLATLVTTGVLEVRIATRVDGCGIYHEKLGIFSDGLGNRVSFKGSSNETWSAWDSRGNVETLEVFCSWRGGLEDERIMRHETHFDTLWSGLDPNIHVMPFPELPAKLLYSASLDSLDAVARTTEHGTSTQRQALPHQVSALEAWRAQGCRGIFEHATGSGKTFTAILTIRDHLLRGLPVLVLVPSQLLLEQWARELSDELPDAVLVLAGGGNDSWRTPSRLRTMTLPDTSLGPRIVLATMHTAATDDFINRVVPGPHLLVIADEVHQIGSPKLSQFLTVDAGSRLGLSATPQRYGDPEGTQRILDYFGPVVQPPFTLADAIANDRLVPYEYHPHPVHLTADEADAWKVLSTEIRREMAIRGDEESGRLHLSERAKHLLIKRARIAKKAEAKVPLAVDIVQRHYHDGQFWLIYCEDKDQLGELLHSLRAVGYRPIEYHSAMVGDRFATLDWFREWGGLLVSIRCLDEGVDIPAITHAIILASSQNPRQFIQRRGRVLRKHPGKAYAVIYDAIVLPTDPQEESDQMGLLKSELARAIEFAQNAINATAAADIRAAAIHMGIDPDDLIDEAMEEDLFD